MEPISAKSNVVMSSLASHFGTNYTPTDDELMEIRELLIAPSARLVELDAELEQKVAEYNAIVEKRAKVKQEIADYRALASPMRRFPVDLLREVFRHCLPTNHNAILSRNKAPMLLTQVCSTWRTIVLDTPVLWASLHIPVPPPVSNATHNYVSDMEQERYKIETVDVIQKRAIAMQEWLARSGACGLNISLHDMNRFSDTWPNTNYEVFLDALLLHSKRWRSMAFTASVDYLRRIAVLTADDVPALEELVISMTDYFVNNGDDEPSIATVNWTNSPVLSASRLHRVSFNNLGENINTLPVHWQQLTHISLTGMSAGIQHMSPVNISSLLAKCPGLVSAKLEIGYDTAVFPQGLGGHLNVTTGLSQLICTSPIMLPYLVDLSLRNRGSNISSFFAVLDMPRLTTLEYHTDIAPEPADEFIALLTRVSETLSNFTTDSLMFSRLDFFAMLKTARRLRSLSNRRALDPPNLWVSQDHGAPHLDDVFLGMLVGRRLCQSNSEEQMQGFEEVAEGYSRILLPELENFECRLPAHFTDEGLLTCLKLRQDIAHTTLYTKFKRFSVKFGRRETRPMSEEVYSLRKAGLALHISHVYVGMGNPLSPAEGIIEETVSEFDTW